MEAPTGADAARVVACDMPGSNETATKETVQSASATDMAGLYRRLPACTRPPSTRSCENMEPLRTVSLRRYCSR